MVLWYLTEAEAHHFTTHTMAIVAKVPVAVTNHCSSSRSGLGGRLDPCRLHHLTLSPDQPLCLSLSLSPAPSRRHLPQLYYPACIIIVA